jgi:hypothetical protein
MFYWVEPVLYLDPVSRFPETTEKLRYFVDIADSMGDALNFKILGNDLITVLHRSVARYAADASHQNKRVIFKPSVEGQIKKMDLKPEVTS